MDNPEISHTFLALDQQWSDMNRSKIVILPAPYEHSTSYGKGTAVAPEAIIHASSFVELYDEELKTEIFRHTDGIATHASMHFGEDCRDADAVALIRETVDSLLGAGKTVITVGGEHTVAVGSALAYTKRFNNLSILQLDAHSDLRQEYEGNRYSHASAMARIYDVHHDIVQVGIRSQSRDEADFIEREGIKTFYDYLIRKRGYGTSRASWIEDVIDSLKENVYITFDCDFLDPALVPAVGTPEPGGFGWYETIAFLRTVSEKRMIIGFDVNELSPLPSTSHSQFIVAKLIYKLIGYMSQNR